MKKLLLLLALLASAHAQTFPIHFAVPCTTGCNTSTGYGTSGAYNTTGATLMAIAIYSLWSESYAITDSTGLNNWATNCTPIYDAAGLGGMNTQLCWVYAPVTSATQTFTCASLTANPDNPVYYGGCFVYIFNTTLTTSSVLDKYEGGSGPEGCSPTGFTPAACGEILVTSTNANDTTPGATFTNAFLTEVDNIAYLVGYHYAGAGGYLLNAPVETFPTNLGWDWSGEAEPDDCVAILFKTPTSSCRHQQPITIGPN